MMKIYLLFLLAIIVTCQANEVTWSRQLNAYSGHRKNDLNQRAYLDEGGGRSDRSIDRTAYDGSVHIVRTRDLNDDVKRADNPSLGANARSPTTLVGGKLPTRRSQTPKAWTVGPNKGSDVARAISQAQRVADKNYIATLTRAHKVDKDPFVWNRAHFDDAASKGHVVRQTRSHPLETSGVNEATFVRRTNNLGQEANVLRSSELNRVRSQENYLNRANGLRQADYARINLVAPVPVARAGNYLNNLDGVAQGLNVERTSYIDRSAPIVRVGNYGPYKPKPDMTKSEPKKDITSDSIRLVAQINQHEYSHPDPEIERKQREQYDPSLLDIAERSIIEDSNNNDRDNTKGINLPGLDPNDEYSLLSDTYGNPNDGYDAPYGYGINDGSEISNQIPYNGYGDMDYNMLPTDFDSFSESGVNSITKNKITNSALIAVYNDSTDQNIYNNTDQKTISDRGSFFDNDLSYTVDHHGFHNTGTFSDDSTKNYGTPYTVEISSNSVPMNSNGKCYCSTNNGHRVCNCDRNYCEGANCHRITPQKTTCGLCKARETTTPKPFVCDICTQPPTPPPPPPPRCECNCEPCRPKCDPCKQRESSCECKQSCSCGCSSCCSESNFCKHSCHSCKPKRPSCNNCESGQEFGSNYEEKLNKYHGENGIHYYEENGNNDYRDNGNNAYNEYYNNYYKNQAAAAFDGSAGGHQFHANVQGNAWTGAYADGLDQITNRGESATEQSGSSGGTVALYADVDLDDAPICSNSNNAASSLSSLPASSKIESSGGNSIKISEGSILTSGGKSSSSASVFGGSAVYGGGGGNPYNNLFSSFSKTGTYHSK